MLAVISDLHFTDGTAGEHNLPASAFEDVFFQELADLARDKVAKEIKLLLLGDIVDFIRTERWFEVEERERPWGEGGLSDIPTPRQAPHNGTERQAIAILGDATDDELSSPTPPPSEDPAVRNSILYRNWRTFWLFRTIREQLEQRNDFVKRLPIEIVYVPGNHDRIVNLYPGLRERVSRYLGMPGGSAPFDWQFMDAAYGVFARHGHEFDMWNYGGGRDLSPDGHLEVPVGDPFTAEFAAKLGWKLREMGAPDDFVRKIQDIDEVFPISAMLEWLSSTRERLTDEHLRRFLDSAVQQSFDELTELSFMRAWHQHDTLVDEAIRCVVSCEPLADLLRGAAELLRPEGILGLYAFFSRFTSHEPDKDAYVRAAWNDAAWKNNPGVFHVVYGHTHRPLQQPLDRCGAREVMYLNSGSWRNRIDRTVGQDKSPDFFTLKQMTYCLFYGTEEATHDKEPGTLSFDIWTGVRKKLHV